MTDLAPRFTPRERTVLIVLALYVSAALILLTPIRGAIGGDRPPAVPPPPSVPGAADRAAPATELGASEQQRARDIVAADRSLAAALRGTRHSIVKSGPWTTSGADGDPARVLGAAFVIAPETPVDLRSAKLPGALYDQSERADPPYQRVVNTVSGDHVTQFLVLVDLERGEVVDITPGPDTQELESAPPPGFERTVPAPRDGGR